MNEKLPFRYRLEAELRNTFLAGILAVVPLAVTFFVLKVIFSLLDGFFSPLIQKAVGYRVPGLGVALTLVFLFLVGLLTRFVFVETIIAWTEALLRKLPLIKNVYHASKQLIETLTLPGKAFFKRVVLIAYPQPDLRALAFVTGSLRDEATGTRLINVFVPVTPNIASGRLILVPEEQVQDTDLTVEQGIKLIVSGGILSPAQFQTAVRAAGRHAD